MSGTSRWLNWKGSAERPASHPQEEHGDKARFLVNAVGAKPKKPTEPGFEGFDGSSPARSIKHKGCVSDFPRIYRGVRAAEIVHETASMVWFKDPVGNHWRYLRRFNQVFPITLESKGHERME